MSLRDLGYLDGSRVYSLRITNAGSGGLYMGGNSSPAPRRRPAPGGGGNGGGGGGGTPNNCDLVLQLTLQATKAPVLSSITTGEDLDVTLRTQGSVTAAVCLVHSSGAVAGTLPLQADDQLFECLAKGYKYVATVISVAGGKCDVEVHRP